MFLQFWYCNIKRIYSINMKRLQKFFIRLQKAYNIFKTVRTEKFNTFAYILFGLICFDLSKRLMIISPIKKRGIIKRIEVITTAKRQNYIESCIKNNCKLFQEI